MSKSDGTVTPGVFDVLKNGPDNDRWVLVFLGDGFTASEQTLYQSAVDSFVNRVMLVTEPFRSMQQLLNVYRIDVISNESGADNPCGAFGKPPTTVKTYFDSTFCAAGVERYIGFNQELARTTVKDKLPGYNAILVIVNSALDGGAAYGDIAAFSLGPGVTTGLLELETGLHELGHCFGLADEYDYLRGANSTETDRNLSSTKPEPMAPNIAIKKPRTTDQRATLKWRYLVDPATALPTTSNPDCSASATRGYRVPSRPAPSGCSRGPTGTTAGRSGRNSAARCGTGPLSTSAGSAKIRSFSDWPG